MAQSVTISHEGRDILIDVRYRHRYISADSILVDGGGLLSYGPSVPANFHRAATYVDKILKGAQPADLPVEQPSRFELLVNLKTAKTLGLIIPPLLLFHAHGFIQ
jgi:putative tryptophan/tyrosine transport system substrate-binding protein